MLLDVALMAEIVWCALWVRARGLQRGLLLAGGILSSGYVALHLSDWLAKTFVSPASAAFLWVQSHLTSDAATVSTLAHFIGPQPAWSGLNQTQWLIVEVVKGVLFVAITLAILLTFVTIGYAADALWDRPPAVHTKLELVAASLIGIGCGVYVAALTNFLLVDLAWLKDFSPVAHALNGSLLFQASKYVLTLG